MALNFNQGKTIEMYMPALSSTMEEGTIVQWLKEVGDKIEVRVCLSVFLCFVISFALDANLRCMGESALATLTGRLLHSGSVFAVILLHSAQTRHATTKFDVVRLPRLGD